MSKTFEFGLHPNVPNDVYQRGLTTPRPLSSTLAKNLLRRLPEEVLWELAHHETKRAYDFGIAVHELILQGGLQTVQELDFDSFRTKEARAARDEAREAGLTPMLASSLTAAREMAAVVREKPENAALLATGGDAEISALVEYDGITMQTRYDYLRLPDETHEGFILDLKTVEGSAHPRGFVRNGASYGYHIQAAMYQVVLELLGYPRLPFIWLVASKTPPYASTLIQASQVDLEVGREMLAAAIVQWKKVLAGETSTTGITQSQFPTWIQYEIEDLTNE